MSLAKLGKSTSNFYAPRFEVKIESIKLPPDLSKAIMDVTVVDKINEGASFTIKVHDQFDMEKQTFTWLDESYFDVGNRVTISMGYGSELKKMVIGNITNLSPSFFSGETPGVTISGHDLSYDFMKRKSEEKTFSKMTYSEIVQDIAKKAGLTAVVDKTSVKVTKTKGSNVSYFVFLQELAVMEGFQVKLDQKKLFFKKPEDDKKEIYTFALGKDIISFKPRMDTSRIVSEVEVRGHNPRDPAKAIVGRAKAGSERTQEGGRQTASQMAQKKIKPPKKVITDVILESVNQANNLAMAMLNNASDTYIGGDVECVGLPDIRPGVCINLEKMGKRFSGKYYVIAATHQIGENGYRTAFEVKRNAV